MDFIKKYWLIIIFALFMLTFSVLFPDLKLELTGGFAWFVVCFVWVFGLAWIYVLIMGGVISFETKGLIPQMRELIKHKKQK